LEEARLAAEDSVVLAAAPPAAAAQADAGDRLLVQKTLSITQCFFCVPLFLCGLLGLLYLLLDIVISSSHSVGR
jgi:hypothetical protein